MSGVSARPTLPDSAPTQARGVLLGRLCMYAVVRRDDRAAPAAADLVRAGRALTAALGHVPGFISCVLLDADGGTLVSIVICEEPAGVEEAGRVLTDWLAAHLVVAPGRPAQVIAGEVIVQRGL